MAKALDTSKGVDGNMAQVIEGGEFGVLFEGEAELRSLHALVEFALATTQSSGVTVGMLNTWHRALEEALTAPRDEEEVEEEEKQRMILTGEMEILPSEATNADKAPVRGRRREE